MATAKKKPKRPAPKPGIPQQPGHRSKPGGPRPLTRSTPCCPSPSDIVTLRMGNGIDPEGGLLFGFERVHASGSSPPGESVAPYGFVIPKGRCLIITDLAYYSDFTKPEAAGDLTRVSLGYLQVMPSGFSQGLIFMTTAVFAKNGSIGGNVTLHTGFVIPNGRYLTVNLYDSELVSTDLYVYGYLTDL
jgi:hypothetical protein